MSAYIHTRDGITVFIRGQQHHVSKDDTAYDIVVDMVSKKASDDVILNAIESTKKKVAKALAFQGSLRYEDGVVYFKDKPVHNYAVDKLIELIDAGLDPTPLANFLYRLYQNPSSSVVEHLYAFLEHGKMPITPNGMFLTYKAVRHDYKDIHSGKFDNSIGCSPRMPRNEVDDRRNVTCSYGFHVCSFEYLPHFSHANGHVMICAVDPAEVVAILSDYNDTKMRVTGYTVIDEVQDYYAKKEHVLGESPIMSFNRTYTVHGVYQDGEGESDALFTTDDYHEAVEFANQEFVQEYEEEWQGVLVRDEGDVVYVA